LYLILSCAKAGVALITNAHSADSKHSFMG
jgi:hypothetical protein